MQTGFRSVFSACKISGRVLCLLYLGIQLITIIEHGRFIYRIWSLGEYEEQTGLGSQVSSFFQLNVKSEKMNPTNLHKYKVHWETN